MLLVDYISMIIGPIIIHEYAVDCITENINNLDPKIKFANEYEVYTEFLLQ